MRRTLALLLLLQAVPASSEDPPRRKLAGLVVRSKDWTIHRGAETVEEWNGDVSYRHRGREIRADWAERRHKDDEWRARGNVKATWKLEDGNVLQARGEEARHHGLKDAGSLAPKRGGFVEFERSSPERADPDRGESRSLEWDLASGRDAGAAGRDDGTAGRVTLEGDVRTWGPSGSSWSDRADYDVRERRLTLTGGRPVLVSGEAWDKRVRDWDAAVQAELVAASDKPRRIAAEGRVRGWVAFRGEPMRP